MYAGRITSDGSSVGTWCREALTIVDTETDRVIRNLGSDYDLAAEIADDWNTHGYSPDRNDPWEHTIWSLTERRLDHDRSAILEQRFTHQEDDQCLEQ